MLSHSNSARLSAGPIPLASGREGPNAKPSARRTERACVKPEERFKNHKAGVKSAYVVKRYGVRLLKDLYEHLNPMPFEAAAQMEMDLAEDLRREGYTVTGGH